MLSSMLLLLLGLSGRQVGCSGVWCVVHSRNHNFRSLGPPLAGSQEARYQQSKHPINERLNSSAKGRACCCCCCSIVAYVSPIKCRGRHLAHGMT